MRGALGCVCTQSGIWAPGTYNINKGPRRCANAAENKRTHTHMRDLYINRKLTLSDSAHSAHAPHRVRSPHVHSSWPSSSPSHSFYRNNQLTQFSLFVFLSGPNGLAAAAAALYAPAHVCMCWRVGSGFGVECARA